MADTQLELNDPAILRVLFDVPTMQRWEILRRTQKPFSAVELAAEANTTVEEAQRSLDMLVEAQLVRVCPATARRRRVAFRAAMERLLLIWDRTKPEDVAAKQAVDDFMRDHSRQLQDEAVRLVRANKLAPNNVNGAISVMLGDEDSMKVRAAFHALYALVIEADKRARSRADRADCTPYHIAFSKTRLSEPPHPMAEFFVLDKESLAKDRPVLKHAPSKVLSPRELQIAKLLEAGRTRPAIAAELGLTPNTVSSLSKLIYRKLGVRSRAELAVRMR